MIRVLKDILPKAQGTLPLAVTGHLAPKHDNVQMVIVLSALQTLHPSRCDPTSIRRMRGRSTNRPATLEHTAHAQSKLLELVIILSTVSHVVFPPN